MEQFSPTDKQGLEKLILCLEREKAQHKKGLFQGVLNM